MRSLLPFIVVFNSIACLGQDFFEDNLKGFSWSAEEKFDTEKIKKIKNINLSILKNSKKSLTVNRTIWSFGDSLTISHYDASQKNERQLGKFKYDLQWDKMLLNIRIDNNETLTYRLIFVSTGSFVSLTREK